MAGLSSKEAHRRLMDVGPNTIPEKKINYVAEFLKKFSAPIPWMLEGMIILEIALKKPTEAGMIAILLLFNATISFFQEERAKKAIRLLKKKLPVTARVLRDDEWRLVPAEEIVPGDFVRIRMGDIIPADVKLTNGILLVDQSVLTGESLPVEAKSGAVCYAGAVVKHGEAFAETVATGAGTYFGKTAEIVRFAKAPSHLEGMIFQIIKYLVSFDILLVLAAFIFSSLYFHLPFIDLVLFSLLLFIASVPIALPAMYTLSTAFGSLELVNAGVLVTHLAAIEEAAAMTILCADKTGTITKNVLEVDRVQPFPPYTEKEVLILAALASEGSTQDPIDLAILKSAGPIPPSFSKLEFIPFDPEKKYSEAIISMNGKEHRIQKGAPSALLPEKQEVVEALASDGSRVLCVAVDGQAAGLLKILDPLREDSAEAIEEIQNLGIRVIMLTGDSAATARAIAEKAGIGSTVIGRDRLQEILKANAVAGVFPEDKYSIIETLQKENYTCGMTGDGVNDAPALKAAEVGIAVANATDVAKASASLVLTSPGLGAILEAVKTSRKIYQRMLTYTLNKIIKTLEISILLSLGLIFERNFIISQVLIVLLLFANDFVTMSLATDRVSYSQKPDSWNIGELMRIGGILAALILGFSFGVLFIGSRYLDISHLQTLIFLTLVFTGQATVYLIRERKNHLWHKAPSVYLLASSVFGIVLVSCFAIEGILMAPLPPLLIFGLFASVVVYFVFLDFLKVHLEILTERKKGREAN